VNLVSGNSVKVQVPSTQDNGEVLSPHTGSPLLGMQSTIRGRLRQRHLGRSNCFRVTYGRSIGTLTALPYSVHEPS